MLNNSKIPRNKHISVGKLGENLACAYLINKGWTLWGRNYRRKSDEMDIIARAPDKTLVFCEVKTLLKNAGLQPEDNLSAAKLRKLTRTCEFFARKYPQLVDSEAGWRMDLLAVDLDRAGQLLEIRHYENI